MLYASKTPDESGNYKHLVRVTYGLGISIRCARTINTYPKEVVTNERTS